ncbi:MAG: hypothetical protein NT062_21720, partial [Proteobacteria bacterium]|nr:hypothetical protein [Pseudomonadota bacterium]
ELTGGEGVLGVGFRGRLAVGRSFGDGAVRPNVTIGALVGSGRLVVDDPRALGAGLALGYQSYGPELQLGLRFVAGDGGHVDSRVFASVSTLRVALDPRLMLDAVPGVSRAGDVGLRASLGGNWIERVTQVNTGGLIFLPQQAEVVWERDAGSTRYGVLLSWGI